MKLSDYWNEYKELKYKKNLKGKEAIKAVEQDGYALQYVIEQTAEICLKAVEQDGYALQYVIEQTAEICLKAVEQDGYALQYVNENLFTQGKVKITANGKTVYISKESADELGL